MITVDITVNDEGKVTDVIMDFLRFEFLRRLYVNTVIFLPRPCLLTVAVTVAPSTVGAPTLTESPPTNNTLSNVKVTYYTGGAKYVCYY
jgi:hypothetical protein